MVRELARYVASQDSTGAMAADMVKIPIFKKPKRSTVRHSAEYLEELEAYFDKEDEWATKVRAWKENCIGIHTLLLDHTHPDVRAYLQKVDGRFGFSLGENEVNKLLSMIRSTMNYMKKEDEKEISTLKSGSDDVDLPVLKNDNLNVRQVRTR